MFVRLAIAFLILASVACSFSGNDNSSARPTATAVVLLPSVTAGVTPATTITPSPNPSATPRPTTSTGNNAPPCIVTTAWPIYVVVSGDTLGTIAQRTSSTATQLASANCLSNANQIFVGQQLRVPRQPDPIVVPTVNVPPGPIMLSPFANYDGLTYFVNPFTQIYIAWPDAARLGANRQVEFYYHGDTDSIVITVGVDIDLGYDAGVYWSIPGNTRGEIWATGRGYNGVVVESPHARIESLQTVPGQNIDPVTLSTYNSFDGLTYRVTANTEVMINWADEFARTAASVEFWYYSTIDPNGIPLGVDNTMMDGASITWTVRTGTNGQLAARVRMPDGLTFETERIGVIAE